jgi:hypothetical protein
MARLANMILPCRIHRSRHCVEFIPFSLLFIAFLLTVAGEATGQEAVGSMVEEAGVSWFPAVPLRITAGVDAGYDDHVLGSSATANSSGQGSQGSFLSRENLVLTYDRPGKGTEIRLIGVGRFTQFLDAGTDDKDLTLTLAVTHNFSTRLSFRADLYAAYQTEPNFQSNVGPQNVRAPHFDTHDIFSLSYHWLPRLSSVTTYTFERIKYEQTTPTTTAVGIAQDRFQHTLDEQLKFSLTKRTNLFVEYRYLIVDYDTAPSDSTTHFALTGFDHNLTEHLRISVRGGPSFRSFQDDGNSINPYAQVTVNYEGGNHSLSWITTYGVEQSTQTVAMGNTTLRTGLIATYNLTSRIHSTAAVYYNHSSNNQGPSGTTLAGSQNALQFTLGLNYTINKHFAAHVDYEYSSQNGQGGYSRNQYYAGLTYTY